jgi:hypothetical protein
MTNDQNTEFLAQLEIDLKNRYTEQDEEYMKCFNAPMPDPPILKIVFKKPRYQNDKNWHSNNHSNNYKDNNYSYKNNRHNSHHYSPFKRNNDNHNRHSYNNNNNNRSNHNQKSTP